MSHYSTVENRNRNSFHDVEARASKVSTLANPAPNSLHKGGAGHIVSAAV